MTDFVFNSPSDILCDAHCLACAQSTCVMCL